MGFETTSSIWQKHQSNGWENRRCISEFSHSEKELNCLLSTLCFHVKSALGISAFYFLFLKADAEKSLYKVTKLWMLSMTIGPYLLVWFGFRSIFASKLKSTENKYSHVLVIKHCLLEEKEVLQSLLSLPATGLYVLHITCCGYSYISLQPLTSDLCLSLVNCMPWRKADQMRC